MNETTDNFDYVLDRCILDIIEGNKSIADCRANYPVYFQELEPFLIIAVKLRKGKELHLSAPEKRILHDRLLQKVHNSSQTVPSKQPNMLPVGSPEGLKRSLRPRGEYPRRNGFAWRFVGALLVVLFSFGIFSGGLINVSAKSIPGEEYYPLKILIEKSQLGLSTSISKDIQLHLRFSSQRLDEAERLIENNRKNLVDNTLSDYSDHISNAVTMLGSAGYLNNQPKPDLLVAAIEILATNQARLEIILKDIPEEQREITVAARDISIQGISVAEEILKLIPELFKIQDADQLMILRRGMTGRKFIKTVSAQRPLATPTLPSVTPPEGWTPIVNPQITPEPVDWLNYTPVNPAVATAWSTIYPTLSHLATRISQITATPRALLRPTRTQQPLLPFNIPRITPTP